MKTVRLKNGIVREIIPDYALPVEKWYGAEFAAECMEAPSEVKQGWIYDGSSFAAPEPEADPEPEPTAEDITLDLMAEHEERLCMLEITTGI